MLEPLRALRGTLPAEEPTAAGQTATIPIPAAGSAGPSCPQGCRMTIIQESVDEIGAGTGRAGNNPVEYNLEQIGSPFYMDLRRHFVRKNERLQSLIVFDRNSYKTCIEGLAAGFRSMGHRFGRVRNLSEVPLFLDSRVSRPVRLADRIADVLFRSLEHRGGRFIEVIQHRFDAEDGAPHGLHGKSR